MCARIYDGVWDYISKPNPVSVVRRKRKTGGLKIA